MAKFDFKKEYKEFYFPKKTPSIINVPKMPFIMVDGKGDPNTSKFYKEAVEVLYGLSYSIKMSKMGSINRWIFRLCCSHVRGTVVVEDNFWRQCYRRKDNFAGYWWSVSRISLHREFWNCKASLSSWKALDWCINSPSRDFRKCSGMHIGSYDMSLLPLRFEELLN